MKQLGHGRLPFAQRFSLAKSLLLSRRELQSRWWTRLGLSLVYSVSLVVGVGGTLSMLMPSMPFALPWESSEAVLSRYQSEQQRRIDRATATLAADPDNLEAYKQRAEARAMLQDTKGALADYDQVLRLSPHDADLRLKRAAFHSISGDHRAALQDYDAILRHDSRHQQALVGRAQTYLLLNDYRSALADHNTLVQLIPDQSWIYVERGHVRQQLRDYRGAIADANAALKLEPDHPDAYQLRSDARRSLGDLKGAEADQQQADLLAETWDSWDD